ncbi:MAG: DUF3408 domain-containing protein [Bacteroides sp.]|nr:DUF3408 domain-containing protein [Bacteroides sp.]
MAKRKEVDVDEDLIKSMMSGDIPRLNKEPVEEKSIPDEEIKIENPSKDEVSEDKTEKENVQSRSKRRREPKDYKSLFLKKESSTKRQTYVSAEMYDKLSKILSIVAKDISVPNFIDNVLENHLKEYKDDINDLYKSNSDLIL